MKRRNNIVLFVCYEANGSIVAFRHFCHAAMIANVANYVFSYLSLLMNFKIDVYSSG